MLVDISPRVALEIINLGGGGNVGHVCSSCKIHILNVGGGGRYTTILPIYQSINQSILCLNTIRLRDYDSSFKIRWCVYMDVLLVRVEFLESIPTGYAILIHFSII